MKFAVDIPNTSSDISSVYNSNANKNCVYFKVVVGITGYEFSLLKAPFILILNKNVIGILKL